MNNEILDYEITVLNKHEDENSLVRAEQKRKVIEDQHCHQDHHHYQDHNFHQLLSHQLLDPSAFAENTVTNGKLKSEF